MIKNVVRQVVRQLRRPAVKQSATGGATTPPPSSGDFDASDFDNSDFNV